MEWVTILIAQPEETIRGALRSALVQAGHTVLEATDAAEAIHVAQRHAGPIHVVITDIVLPELAGDALIEHLRAERPEIRVLYMPGHAPGLLLEETDVAPGRSFPPPEFDAEAIQERVRQALENHGRRHAGA